MRNYMPEEVKGELFDPTIKNTTLKKMKIRVRAIGRKGAELPLAWTQFLARFEGLQYLAFSGVSFKSFMLHGLF